MSHGRPRVELLAIRADLRVKDTEIIVYDGRRGQIIYRKEEVGQGDQVYIYESKMCVRASVISNISYFDTYMNLSKQY
jgi:hypothetical protein